MLLTLTTTHNPATDLGHLLHKNPSRPQTFDASVGKVTSIYPEATEERCTATARLHGARDLERLRSRALGGKRSVARSEFAIGIEGLEPFVRDEPLRGVHECAFAVLAMESEPVDPRL